MELLFFAIIVIEANMTNIQDRFSKFIDNALVNILGKKKYSSTFFTKVLKEGDSLCLRAPDTVPEYVINGFSTLFEKHSSILAAYVATGFVSMDEREPHYIIGLRIDPKANQTIGQLMQSMAADLGKVVPKDLFIDFILVGDVDAPIDNFMRNCLIPFYTRH